MLNSDSEQVRLRAAQSLFSYSSAKPPAEQPEVVREPGTGGGVSLLEVFDCALTLDYVPGLEELLGKHGWQKRGPVDRQNS